MKKYASVIAVMVSFWYCGASQAMIVNWDHVVQSITDGTVNVNCRNLQTGNTFLHEAVLENNINMAEFLIHFGAFPNTQNAQGGTLLHFASVVYAF